MANVANVIENELNQKIDQKDNEIALIKKQLEEQISLQEHKYSHEIKSTQSEFENIISKLNKEISGLQV